MGLILGRISSTVWLAVVIGLGLLCCAQTLRLYGVQAELSELKLSVAEDDALRASAHLDAVESRRNAERAFQIKTQGASDALTTSKANTERVLRRDLDDARSLLGSAAQRNAAYRASAESGAATCRSLADRTEALDRLVTEGVGMVAEGKSIVAARDAEIVALWAYMQELRRLLGVEAE